MKGIVRRREGEGEWKIEEEKRREIEVRGEKG